MAFACIHTHSNFCDGSDDIETICRTAHEKGMHSVGFSSHAPITAKTGMSGGWIMNDEKLDAYLECVRAAKKRWEGRIAVFLGLEVDYIEGLMGPADSDYREMNLDYIIGSVHFVVPPHGAPFTVDDSAENVDRGVREGYGGDARAMMAAYWEAEEAMIRAGGFDVLGHPDLVKKNNSNMRLFPENDEYYRNKTALIAALMCGTGIPAEINTGGISRGKIKDCYPSLEFLKLFHECGVPMVINADAHCARDLDGNYDIACESMLAAGYTETVIFGGRENGQAVWEKVKL